MASLKTTVASVLVLTSTLALAAPAAAQFSKGTVEVALQAGGSIDTRHTDRSRVLVSRSLAYSATDRLQIGLRLGEAVDREGDVASLTRAEADLLLPPAGRVVPYIGAHGGALLSFDGDVAAKGMYGVQMGGKIALGEKFGVGLEAACSLPMTGTETASVSVVAVLFWLFPPQRAGEN